MIKELNFVYYRNLSNLKKIIKFCLSNFKSHYHRIFISLKKNCCLIVQSKILFLQSDDGAYTVK